MPGAAVRCSTPVATVLGRPVETIRATGEVRGLGRR